MYSDHTSSISGESISSDQWLRILNQKSIGIISTTRSMAIVLIAMGWFFAQSYALAQDPWRGIRPQVLTEQQFTDFISIVKEITEKNINLSPPENTTPDQEAALMAQNPAVVEILDRYGYSPVEFIPLSVNVVMAHVIASSPSSIADVDAQISKLNTEKDTMDEQQYQTMLTMLDQQKNFLKSAPSENVQMAGKFTDALNAMTTGGSEQ